MKQGKLLIISAPSGSGKSTIVNWLMKEHPELKLTFSISCTSRAPRGTEQNGVEYYFITADEFRERIHDYQVRCPQLLPVFVAPEEGRDCGKFFRSAVLEHLNGGRVITTYLDNDDALDIHFVEDLQQRSTDLADGTFVYYANGYQYFTEFGLLLGIKYKRNHFVSVIEAGSPETLKTIFGYGSHYYIDKIPGAAIEYVKGRPFWCEVIHLRNMGNDAYFLWGTRMMRDERILKQDFAIDEIPRHGFALYAFRFIPRYVAVFFRRIKYFFFGRKW